MTATLAGDVDRLSGNPPLVGETELGRITISDQVVGKIAAQAVLEIPDAGGAAPRVFGRSMPGAGRLGIRRTALSEAPKATADIDGRLAYLDLVISTRWPASVSQVTEQVRDHIRARVHALTGLTVDEVRITVAGLITDVTPATRVR
jgi:uncharacterized alkaline shock family protein YloU